MKLLVFIALGVGVGTVLFLCALARAAWLLLKHMANELWGEPWSEPLPVERRSEMFKGLKRILGSSKCWLCVGACITAGATGNWVAIPNLVIATIVAIAAEDAAQKLGQKKQLERVHD